MDLKNQHLYLKAMEIKSTLCSYAYFSFSPQARGKNGSEK